MLCVYMYIEKKTERMYVNVSYSSIWVVISVPFICCLYVSKFSVLCMYSFVKSKIEQKLRFREPATTTYISLPLFILFLILRGFFFLTHSSPFFFVSMLYAFPPVAFLPASSP